MVKVNLTNREVHTIWVVLRGERKEMGTKKARSYSDSLSVIMKKMEKVM